MNAIGIGHCASMRWSATRWLFVLFLCLGMWFGGCECGEIVSRSCVNNDDCANSAPMIYCFEQRCSTFQCNPGNQKACYDGPIETRDKGICVGGTQTCLGTGLWSACLGQVLARPELCDRIDNDCNGKIDDGLDCRCTPGSKQQCYNGPGDTFGRGECKAGIQFCGRDSQWGKCFEQSLPSPERCDRIDNDCNGKIDDGIDCSCEPGESRPCYSKSSGCKAVIDGEGWQCKGSCQQGKQFCTDQRRWGKCSDEVVPTQEICNGKDDNCDGQVDEIYPELGRTCPIDDLKGPCRNGLLSCKDGKLTCTQSYQPKEEICGNGIDDDCDGTINESPPCNCKPGTNRICYSFGSGCTQQADGTFVCKGSCSAGRMNCQEDQTWGPCLGQTGPEKKELCDGRDNDCDGEIDEDWPNKGKECSVGLGACQKQGRFVCKSDGSSLLCDELPGAPKLEVCDGIDNDCNGKIDDNLIQQCYTGPKDTAGRGNCRRGEQLCVNGQWGACQKEIQPTKEVCDGQDNDCDGLVDEDWMILNRPCFVGQGECRTEGLGACTQDGKGAECLATLPQGSKEICDDKDNDCDGQIDEDFPNKGQACTGGQGGCKVKGTYTCSSNGNKTICSEGGKKPKAERCNNKDDDCNGQIDDNLTRTCYSGPNNTRNKGECQPGTQVCSAGNWGTCTGDVTPQPEICDGKDNNCDGKIDEGCQCQNNATQPCGKHVGECRKGSQTCQSGQWGSCIGEIPPSAEVCDNKDNDCNGQIDDNLTRPCYSGTNGTAGKGECQEGTETCQIGKWSTCIGEITPQTELCDGKDNDCDGQIDEDWPQLKQTCTVGLGECQVQGTAICTADGTTTVCDRSPKTPQAEQCDNKDNDCDGKVDDNLTRPCYSGSQQTRGVGTCREGTETCQAGMWSACVGEIVPRAETCDGKDDNCDGQIDEGCQCVNGKTQSCGNSTGECTQGNQTCQSGQWGICTGGTQPIPEDCDGKDNDCDGRVDEGLFLRPCYTGPPKTEGVGECRRGRRSCSNGSWGSCLGQRTPQPEKCEDEKDNDCDGKTDEGCN